MAIKTHAMNLGTSKNKISQTVGTSFAPEKLPSLL